MRILVSPDSFGTTLSAPQAASAIADGWRDVCGEDELELVPMSDGGPGFIDVLEQVLDATAIDVPTVDPLGRPVTGRVLVTRDGAGYVESAHAAGLHLLAEHERDPGRATSYGVGTLMIAAAQAGARVIYVGLGGSATNDGGAGLLAAVGVVAYDAAGVALPLGALPLLSVDHVAGYATLYQAAVVAASDVDSPLLGPHGASAVFGPQKGASAQDVVVLEEALRRFAAVLQRDRATVPDDVASLPGAGAAGGMGMAIYALNGQRRSGFEVVSSAVQLPARIAAADLVLTGEGKLDEQSVRGKVVAGIAALARDAGVPCLAVAGQVSLDADTLEAHGVRRAYSMVEEVGQERAFAAAYDALRETTAVAAREWIGD